jgi:tetratricopeptide (TPR) repeat protein
MRLREGRLDEAREALERIAERKETPRHLRDRAVEELADLALGAGRGEEAARRYRDLMTRTADEDQLRQLEVKIAAAEDARLRPAVLALLVGTPQRGPDRTMAMEQLGALTASAPDEGIAWYLLARQYLNAGQYDDAAARLDRALGATLRVARVRLEAERLRLVIACATGDREGAARAFTRYAAHEEVSLARREAARSLLERCSGSPAPAPLEYDAGASPGGR